MIEQERLFSMQSVLRCYKPELAVVLVKFSYINHKEYEGEKLYGVAVAEERGQFEYKEEGERPM
jgi:hypothetical protein